MVTVNDTLYLNQACYHSVWCWYWSCACLQCKWSRKGFMRTRWNLNGTVFDLINIHLFHDASNFVAIESVSIVPCMESWFIVLAYIFYPYILSVVKASLISYFFIFFPLSFHLSIAKTVRELWSILLKGNEWKI